MKLVDKILERRNTRIDDDHKRRQEIQREKIIEAFEAFCNLAGKTSKTVDVFVAVVRDTLEGETSS